MKTLIASVLLVAIALAEPPPSHSYLPPSPVGRSTTGYPQAGGPQNFEPQIIAARSLGQNFGAQSTPNAKAGNGFARSSLQNQGVHGPQARFSTEEQGYDHNANAFGRNSIDDVSSEPAYYNFGYMVNDYQEGTDFGHHEERVEERAQGEYHVVLPDGRKQTVSYEADERGFKPHITYEDSDDSFARSAGYDANANNARANFGNHGNEYNGGSSHGNARSNGY